VAVLAYVRQIRPDILSQTSDPCSITRGRLLLVTLGIGALLLSAVVSLYASDRPDGLEWSYAERPDQPEFESMVQAHEQAKALDTLQSKYTLLPDYARRPAPMGHINTDNPVAASWTSFAGVVGSLITMTLVWGIALLIRKRAARI
jgi:cobalt/nickel transport system permease protein